MLNTATKSRKPPVLVGVEIMRGSIKKEPVLIIISVLSVSEKKTLCQ